MIKSRSVRWAGHAACIRNMRCVQDSGSNPEGNRPLGKPRFKWEDNIKMDFREMGLEGVIRFIWVRVGTGYRL
jgi:hypothetical protein